MYCRICNGSIDLYPQNGARCKQCGSICAVTLPSTEELSRYYEKFNLNYHGGGREDNADNRQKRYAKKYLEVVNQYSTGKKLIDIGSSTNPFPNYALNQGYNVTVLDYLKPKDLSSNIEFIAGAIDNEEFCSINSQYHTVTLFAVIEHCRYPHSAVRNLSRLCESGGHIILTTPEIGRFADQYALGRTGWFFPPEHLHIISESGMKKLFAEFDCTLVKSVRFELNLIRWLARYGIGLMEGTAGYLVKQFNPTFWSKAQKNRVSANQGITLYIFRKN